MSGDVVIGEISIRVPGVDREDGRRLGRLVAERLVPELALAPGEASLDRLTIELRTAPLESPESLAGRIAAQVALLVGGAGAVEAGR
jgi:hypothetical protein